MSEKFVEPGMILEEVNIALESGRCPSCGISLVIQSNGRDIDCECPGCGWCGGMSGCF